MDSNGPDMSPLSSQLSSHGSSEFGDDIKVEDHDHSREPLPDDEMLHVPPAKRRRTGQYSHQSTPAPLHEPEDLGEISSDTSGSVPGSPTGQDGFRFAEDDPSVSPEQVTVCKWKDCARGDCSDMDTLVQHIHDDHIGKNKKRYACEWEGCNKKETTTPNAHASGYALKAHMRSHTKEKPFYCRLPECDRSFTRSDALAKHMRTVHETEALRPSDPVPKNYSSIPPKPQRLKLIVNSKPRDQLEGNEDTEVDDEATVNNSDQAMDDHDAVPLEYPAELQFTEEELAMPSDQLYRLLRRQYHWAEVESAELLDEVQALEAKKKQEWVQKELLLANVMEAELANAHDRGEPQQNVQIHLLDLPQPILPMVGREQPWYRVLAAPVEEPPPPPIKGEVPMGEELQGEKSQAMPIGEGV